MELRLEELSLEVRVVGVPLWSDQPTKSKNIIEDVWEVGIRARLVELGVAGREEIKKCRGNDGGAEKGGSWLCKH